MAADRVVARAAVQEVVTEPADDSQIVSPCPFGSLSGFVKVLSRSSCGGRAAETVT